jgi:ankyrin repeat protein
VSPSCCGASCIASSCDDFRFRWAFCQLETLRRCPLQKIRSTLDALPRTLDETYERTLQGIDEKKWEYACRIFQFLTISERPLYVQELAEVFAISINEKTTGIPEFNPRWREPDAESALLSACPSLIAVVKDSKNYGERVVQFSHFSVQDFLTSDRLQRSPRLSRYYILPRSAHTLFAKVCLSVLLQLNSRIHKYSVKGMFPLANYAAQYWVSHAQRGDVSLIEDGMVRLFDKHRSHFAAWIWVYNIDNPSGPHMDGTHPGIPETAPLYYAAFSGFLYMVERLAALHLDDVNTLGRDGGTPLHAALRNGHSDVALLLLRYNANTNAPDSRDETPLHIASRRGDIDAIRFLFDLGANLNAKNRDNETPLSLATRNGSVDAAQLLLEHGADLHHQVALGWTPLHVAAEHGHNDIANLLLDYGANVDVRDRDYRTPLHLAADQGKVGVAKLLLKRGADVNAREVSQLTPLHMASSGGQVESARLLLDFGADVNASDGDGWTPLHLAAYNGHLQVGELLVGHGAVRDGENEDGCTPFRLASEGQHTEIAQMLQRDVDVGRRGW